MKIKDTIETITVGDCVNFPFANTDRDGCDVLGKDISWKTGEMRENYCPLPILVVPEKKPFKPKGQIGQ